jgi:hypothetical protein
MVHLLLNRSYRKQGNYRENEMATPLFVIGKHRSGTSFLANLLLDHPKITSVHYPPDSQTYKSGVCESCFFYGIDKRYGDISIFENFVEFASVVSRSDYFKLAGSSFDDLISYYKADYPNVFRYVMDKFAEHKGAAYWIEKTPSHTLLIKTIKKYYPDAKFVGIIRNEVDTALSSLHLKKKQDKPRLVRLWALIKVTILKYIYDILMTKFKKIYPDDILIIDYSQLVTNKAKVTAGICDFLGLQQKELSTKFLKNTVYKSESDKRSYGYERFFIRLIYKYLLRVVPYKLLSILAKKQIKIKHSKLPAWFFKSQRQRKGESLL